MGSIYFFIFIISLVPIIIYLFTHKSKLLKIYSIILIIFYIAYSSYMIIIDFINIACLYELFDFRSIIIYFMTIGLIPILIYLFKSKAK